jgi:hypothetical protein
MIPPKIFFLSAAFCTLVASPPVYAAKKAQGIDLRAYMHGIESVQDADGGTHVFFSSSGLPPTGADAQRNWTHDVYVASWEPADDKISEPRVFISNPEAQEPVSVAQTSNGNIMVSFEDGWNTESNVNQRFGVYDKNLDPVKPYPNNVATGGHSGHVAAVGDNFVVFYSDDWVDGGGVDNLGTGKGVYAKIYDSTGNFRRTVPVAAKKREWWPMLASSPTKALLVWQQFVPKQTFANLKIALLDPATGALTKPVVLQKNLQYYTYKVAYVAAIDRFLVTGATVNGKGFAYLVDNAGQTTASLPCMPAIVREAGITVHGAMAYTPSQDQRLLHLALTPQLITLQAVQPSPLAWSYTGSLGLVRNANSLHWVSLTRGGLDEANFDLKAAMPPTDVDRCGK